MFGIEEILKKPVAEARAAMSETVAKLGPLLSDVETRAAIIAHGLLDRFQVEIHISLKPDPTRYPKANEIKASDQK